MGKYIRKPKTAGEVAVMELSQPSLGVRTRAKTLALRRQQNSSSTVASAPVTGEGSYLQLRSRRLEKPPIVVNHHDSKRHKQQQRQGSKKDNHPNLDSRVPVGSGSNPEEEKQGENINNESNDFGGIEASFGENVLDTEPRERGTRESTPCSLIRDPESIRTPGSTTKPITNSADTNQRVRNSAQRNIPTTNETDEFFAHAEVDQQRQFIEKYNFDPVKEKPLPGRYQWEKVDK